MRSLRGCRGALAAEATTEEGDAELQDGAERLKRGLSIPAGSLRAEPLNLRRPTLDAKREYNNNCEKKNKTMHEVLRLRGRRGRGRGCWNDNAGRTWPPDGGWRAGRVFRNCSTASRPALGARRGWRGAARAPRIDYTPLRTALPAGLRKFVRRLADEWYPPHSRGPEDVKVRPEVPGRTFRYCYGVEKFV